MKAELKAILQALRDRTEPDGIRCVPFAPLIEDTGIDRRKVRLGVRRLARMKLAEYWRGLCTDMGEFAGAGYCITHAGIDFLSNCGEQECRLS